MAIEKKRGCGFRKVGGQYLVGGGAGIPCDRLPFELTVCPCCSAGFKPALGFTWMDVTKLFGGNHVWQKNEIAPRPCGCNGGFCPLCYAPEKLGKAGLLWIGEKFYKTPEAFLAEGVEMGFSRRIKSIPHGFKVGETYVMLAHKNAVKIVTSSDLEKVNPSLDKVAPKVEYKPGIFYFWLPTRVELIFKESDRGSEAVQAAEKRGITAVFVPDDDPDHQGNVHDDFAAEQKAKREAEDADSE